MKKTYYKNFVPDVYEGDGKVRYCLGKNGNKVLFCIGINPSTANLEDSDPTMDILINISQTKGYDGCIMINPAPYCSEKPQKLPNKADDKIEKNFKTIETLFKKYKNNTVLCSWGDYIKKDYCPEWYKNSLDSIIELAKQYGMKFVYIRLNKDSGEPTHISRLNQHINGFKSGKGTYSLIDFEL